VLDESWQHEGHAGANGTGFGTHFRVRIASPLFTGLPAWRAIALCMMRCKISLTGASHAIAIEIL
jgi:BolA protein